MKLTRRGRRARALAIALLLLGIVYVKVGMDPIYSECRQTIEGEVCTLIGYERGR
jgi:hypothetical protein